jgi:formylglycine-generating enzyme
MSRIFALLSSLCVLFIPLRVWAAITIATVPVGNAGNPSDPHNNPIGSVGYSYSIGEYDVTVGQYAAFLNAVAATDTYGLYNPSLATDLNVAGIARSGASGSYTYSVIGSPNHPITYVSWGDAARFSNWLANGQPNGTEGPGTTETGSYTLNGATTSGLLQNINRNPSATWVIPTLNEWYKAAYYNPSTGSYYAYPFSSNFPPTSAMPGSTPNTGNITTNSLSGSNNAYAVTGSTSYFPNQNYLTDVGAYTASASPYGAFDMGGDVSQWTEYVGSSGRLMRGGNWGGPSNLLGSVSPLFILENPTGETSGIGFRVALVPEPSAMVLASVAGVLVWALRKRFR